MEHADQSVSGEHRMALDDLRDLLDEEPFTLEDAGAILGTRGLQIDIGSVTEGALPGGHALMQSRNGLPSSSTSGADLAAAFAVGRKLAASDQAPPTLRKICLLLSRSLVSLALASGARPLPAGVSQATLVRLALTDVDTCLREAGTLEDDGALEPFQQRMNEEAGLFLAIAALPSFTDESGLLFPHAFVS